MYNWKWNLSDIKQNKDVTVFSTFSCGGGSSMGYKRAGFKVIGNVEIDPRVNELYVKNLRPKHNYLMDLRDFNALKDLPEELYSLDILDGSPPCSTFSTAGEREKNWGKKKKFREGQKAQVLDDLFFVFLDTVEKLHPKVVVAENVTGIVKGNAKGYVNEIIKRFHDIGYEVQIFKLNSANMGVPQVRERVFFIANNQGFQKLKLHFTEPPILFGDVRTAEGKQINRNTDTYKLLMRARKNEKNFSQVLRRTENRDGRYNENICHDDFVCATITASGGFLRYCDKTRFSDGDYRNVQTFPQDYDFCGRSAHYVCGMSVPPVMMANIAAEIYEQWLKR